MNSYLALSVVRPAGDWIRDGEKTLEIRTWKPDTLPLRDLVIVQNNIRLSSTGTTEDPEGEAVALVDVEAVEPWKETDVDPACASYWEPGWQAWRLTHVRPLRAGLRVPARLRIYPLELPGMSVSRLHIITGAPGAGKSSLIDELRARGHLCVDEAGRDIIREQTEIGGDGTHQLNPVKFRDLMLSRMLHDYRRVSAAPGPVFFDRGIPGLLGYSRLIGAPVPDYLRRAVALHRYNPVVFFAPPWPEIYRNDTERAQDLAEARATYEHLHHGYHEAGYRAVELPKVSIAERVEFVLSTLAQHSSA